MNKKPKYDKPPVKKRDIIKVISDKTNIDKGATEAIVDAFIILLKRLIANGDTITLRSLGTFKPVVQKASQGYDFKLGKHVPCKPHFIAKYVPSMEIQKKLKDKTIE